MRVLLEGEHPDSVRLKLVCRCGEKLEFDPGPAINGEVVLTVKVCENCISDALGDPPDW